MRAYTEALGVASEDPELGATRFRVFLERYPDGPFADDAVLRLAELDRQRGRPFDAIPALRRVIADHPTGDRTDAARLVLAQLEKEREQIEAASRVADEIRLPLLTEPERRQAHRLLADLAEARGDRAEQVRWLMRVRADARDAEAAERVEAEIEAAVEEMSAEELEAAARELGRRVPAARLWLLAAERALAAGQVEQAEAALASAQELPLSSEDAARLRELEAALGLAPEERKPLALPPPFAEAAAHPLPSSEAVAGRLGVVLPLSGSRPLDAAAEDSLQGILLGARLFGHELAFAGGAGVELAVRDTGGDPARAAEAVRELEEEEGVSAVIGPLTVREAEAAAEVADASELPLLALTHETRVADNRPGVFRFGLTRRAEAEVLAEYAVATLGLERFAILYPNDDYGREFEKLFWQAVEVRGGRVVGVARYEPTVTDYAEPIRRLIGYVLLTPAERAALAERRSMLERAKRLPAEEARELRREAQELLGPEDQPLPPIVDFEALFIPDSHVNVQLILPQLAYHQVEGVRLLGSSGWNDPDLVRIAGSHAEGAVFSADFDPTNPHPQIADFVERYRATFEEEPTVFAAQAFDATRLVLLQLARGMSGPVGLRDGLLSTRAYPGVSGVTSFRPDGNAVKRPFLLGIERGHIVALDGREPPAVPVPASQILEAEAGEE